MHRGGNAESGESPTPRAANVGVSTSPDPFTPPRGGFDNSPTNLRKDVTHSSRKVTRGTVIHTVGVVPPDVVADPVYDVDSGTFSTTPLSLLLPGEVVRWGGEFYHACPQCWGVFSLSKHDVTVASSGVINVDPSIVCPSCGLHCTYEDGRVDVTTHDDTNPGDEEWAETVRKRAKFVHKHRESDVERLVSRNYREIADTIRSDTE